MVMQLIGAGLMAGGTLASLAGANKQESAMKRVSQKRGREQEALNQQRSEALSGALQGVTQDIQTQNAASQAAAQGLLSRQFAPQEIGQVPVQQAPVFAQAQQSGPGARIAQQMQAQNQPGIDASNFLAGQQLSNIAAQRQASDAMRQFGLAQMAQNLGSFRRQSAYDLESANIGLADLGSRLAMERAMQNAMQEGSTLQALGSLGQSIGGSMLGMGGMGGGLGMGGN